jgi:PmbA protein
MFLKKFENFIKDNCRGFEYELYLLRRKKINISTENGNFEKVTTAEDYGLGIRLLKDKKIGFSYTTQLEEGALKKLLEELKEITLLSPSDEANGFCERKEESNVNSPYDGKAVNIPLDEKIEFVINFERELLEGGKPYAVGTRETSFHDTVYEVEFLNSYGVEFTYSGTNYTLITSLLARSESGDTNIGWGYKSSQYLDSLGLEELKEDLYLKVIQTLDPKPFETKKLPVVFYRESFASLLETFSDIFLGDNAVRKKTALLDKVGEHIASELITIVDDGTLTDGTMTHPYDDEGVPQKRKVVVDKGTFNGFLHSLYTARKMNEIPTGNGFRSGFSSLPRSGISNFYLEPLVGTLEGLINSESEIVVIVDLMGLHTADPISGNFSLGASGLYYKNGKRVQSVRGLTVAGNFFELLKNTVAVGGDLSFYGNVGTPSVLVKNITLGGTK